MQNLEKQFTLVIPTYNRAKELKCNLDFQRAQGLKSKVLVLDSSRKDVKKQNADTISSCKLDVEHVQYDNDTHPFDKFGDGVGRVKTPYVALCADDDLLLKSGLDASLHALHKDEDAVVAHGYYVMFGHFQAKEDIDLSTFLYFSPSILGDDKFERLYTLLESYQALTYGVFRTPVLRSVYNTGGKIKSLLFRELLTGALPVLSGKVLRVPFFYGARAHDVGDDQQRQCWHPLEWFMRDAKSMFEEYARYRTILVDYVLDISDDERSRVERAVDLIHAKYFFKHLPPEIFMTILDAEGQGGKIDDYWGDSKIQNALLEAHNSGSPDSNSEFFSLPLMRRVAPVFPDGVIDIEANKSLFWPIVIRTPCRDYRFHQGFFDDRLQNIVNMDAPMIKELINDLDCYCSAS